jgi:hypothetical protein
MKLSKEEYLELSEDYSGYCSTCDDTTIDSVEPDAYDCHCPVCNGYTGMGLENALLIGKIEITEEE